MLAIDKTAEKSPKETAVSEQSQGARSTGSNTYLIGEEQLQQALLRQKNSKKSLVETLLEMQIISQEEMTKISNLRVYAIPSIKLSMEIFSKEVLDLIPRYFCLEHTVLPLHYRNNIFSVAIADPMNVPAIERLRDMVRGEIKVYHAEADEIKEYIGKLYPEKEEGKTEEMLLTVKEISDTIEDTQDEEQTGTIAPDAGPVVRLVDSTLRQAMERGASDVHWEAHPKESVVRFRVDGHLSDFLRFPKQIHNAVVSRIKILAGMDISETRRPQDGRCFISTGGKKADLRISTVHSLFGEKVVIRILDKSSEIVAMEKSGMSQYNYDLLLDVTNHAQGMILATGPTGSGKTTLLYAILQKIMSLEKNVVTIEDPIEYQLPRINQIPVLRKAGVSFANILRTVLRQDPDIIMVGEIRDLETAEIAIQAAQTGHLVLATLHTNDAPGAVTRLIDLGVKPFLVATAVTGVIAQRLVRQICSECRESYEPTSEERVLAVRRQIELPKILYRGKGCARCAGTGYKGRIGLHEVLKVTYRVQHQIMAGTSGMGDVNETCLEEGMIPLLQDAMQKVASGITTFQEVIHGVS